MEDKIFSLIVDRQEISWKSLMYDLVKQEGMNPWDVDVSRLAQLYLERVQKMKEIDLHVSGKVVLAAAILLRLKSKRLVGEDVDEFDRLIAASEAEQFYDELEQQLVSGEERAIMENVELLPRTPQPRARKVSIHELVRALEKALEVKKRRLWNALPPGQVVLPKKVFDVHEASAQLYAKIVQFFADKNTHVTFSHLVPSREKQDTIYTFIPLLQLSHQQKVDLLQEDHFGDIHISLAEQKPVAE